jgi:hypothetical protein
MKGESRAKMLHKFAEFVVALDDPGATELRRSITLSEIIELGRAALAGEPVPIQTPAQGRPVVVPEGNTPQERETTIWLQGPDKKR